MSHRYTKLFFPSLFFHLKHNTREKNVPNEEKVSRNRLAVVKESFFIFLRLHSINLIITLGHVEVIKSNTAT